MMRRPLTACIFALLLCPVFLCRSAAAEEESAEKLLRRASDAAGESKTAEAVKLATMAIERDEKLAFAYYVRGREYFRLAKVKQSVVDFDKFVELRPDLESRQWERGISFYYARQYEKGAKQFELYQTYHDNDVENSTWRYLCMAPTTGVEKARETMLPIENDRRVPMMQIYDMFRGKLKAEDVLTAAREGEPGESALNRRLFYAHLYIGLHYEAAGNKELAKKHITKAAEDHKIGHYMWDVANVHAQMLRAAKAE